MVMIWYHMIAFAIGIVLDLIIGDPYKMPHPIRLIGRFIGYLDRKALPDSIKSREEENAQAATIVLRDEEKERAKGMRIVLLVTGSVFVAMVIIIIGTYLITPYLGIAVEAVLTAYTLAAKSLKTESMKVYKELKKGDLEQARYAVSMIVGRDTDSLDAQGVTKAAVETVAENASDGVIAPMLYSFIGGPVFSMTYKAINTMDSMIGYKNNRYLHLGRAAAKLDDAVNFVPARISAWLIILAAFLLERFGKKSGDFSYSSKEAARIFKRDRFNHKSPNSAQTESAVAGALGVELAGDAVYFSKLVKKPTMGDKKRQIEPEDIGRANNLMYTAFIAGGIICLAILAVIQRIL